MKVYLFNNSRPGTDWNTCYAMAETGQVLASHVCSHYSFMRGDLYFGRSERKEKWAKIFPEGVEIIEVPNGELPPAEVMERNKTAKPFNEAELSSIEMVVADDKGKERTIKQTF